MAGDPVAGVVAAGLHTRRTRRPHRWRSCRRGRAGRQQRGDEARPASNRGRRCGAPPPAARTAPATARAGAKPKPSPRSPPGPGASSPRISLSAADAVLLEISSCLRLFGGTAQIESALREGLAELGFTAPLGCAPTPLAARWFAGGRFPPSPAPDRRGTPTDAAGQDWRAALDLLPLELLSEEDACDAATLELLAGLGLRTLASFAACRPPDFAAVVRRRPRGRWRGRAANSPITPWFSAAAPSTIGIALPAPELHAEALLFAARRLFASLAAWL